ncbi:glycine betaine ABC transporter substrate-binding protein [Brevibacterium senegalense]|uniref:glycine betaine ABC transporter substrate-binding protein n=1 Tax=Brevibacterium senegalense TaxID=1033736 RepID=UPI0003047EB1|nr:glycine betaine ABC transporter substrate-binding protein [Brevibacterium senegalense]
MAFRRMMTAVGAAAIVALGVSACGATDADAGGDATDEAAVGETDWSACTPGEESAEVDLSGAEDKDIKIGAFNGWDESYAAAYITKYALEQDGYSVSVESFDAGPAFTAVSQGDIDFIMDGWLPVTHEDYIAQFGDDMEAQGCWYTGAKNTIAVNEDSPAQSLADLRDMSDEYGSTIYGIEAGAGLTRMTEEDMIPTYGLEDWDFKISSTPAMLAQLQSSTNADENIVVTLWRPHWAYDAFPVRDLEDPEGAMGAGEVIYNFAYSGFGEEHPEVSQLLKNLVIGDETLASMENIMFSDEHYGGENLDDAVAEWVEENDGFVDDWKAGALAG